MDDILAALADTPWIWPLFVASFAVWIAAVVVIFRSKKFLRKWLWALFTFLSFSYGWQVKPNASISIGLPIGALYVLGFWLFGPHPTTEQIARDNAKRDERERANRVSASAPDAGRRVAALRIGYALAALGALAFSVIAGSGAITDAMFSAAHGGSHMKPIFPPGFNIAMGVSLDAVAALFVFLAFRPYWWGKILCLWAGLSWTGFGVVSFLIIPGHFGVSGTALAAGLAVLLAALIHQFADPRFSGPYLRSA